MSEDNTVRPPLDPAARRALAAAYDVLLHAADEARNYHPIHRVAAGPTACQVLAREIERARAAGAEVIYLDDPAGVTAARARMATLSWPQLALVVTSSWESLPPATQDLAAWVVQAGRKHGATFCGVAASFDSVPPRLLADVERLSAPDQDPATPDPAL